MTASSRSVPGEQRVFSLLLALVASPQGLTKRELLSSVHGYAQRYQHGVTDPALERQFERDKDQVRSLGIPIETIDSPGEAENNQLTRYRISKDLLEIPPQVRFTAEELALLRAASLAWSESSLSVTSRQAAMKLQSLGAGIETQHLGAAPRLEIPEPAAPALQAAIDQGKIVRFDYQLPDRDQPLERRVAPLRLHRADGRWHLVSWDLERDDDRVFLLSRITSEVIIERQSFDAGLREHVDRVVDELLSLKERQRAIIDVRRGSIAEARLSPRSTVREISDDRQARLVLGTLDPRSLAEELSGYGSDVSVDSPPRLRDEVLEILARIRDQHEAEGGADGK